MIQCQELVHCKQGPQPHTQHHKEEVGHTGETFPLQQSKWALMQLYKVVSWWLSEAPDNNKCADVCL